MRGLVGWARARAIAAALTCVFAATVAEAGDILARISVRNAGIGNSHYGRTFEFPADVRDYSDRSFYGYSFREELVSGGVRELEIARVRSPGAYLIATDLFANGRFSTMSHTVLVVFPRRELYSLSEEPTGNLRIRAPDGSWLRIDGRTEGVLPTAAFELAAQGPTGTPPRLLHRGLHLEITSVGRSPFLRGTPVTVADGIGGSCRLSTDEVFRYGGGPESDVFRFDTDRELFRFLAIRCPDLELPNHGFAMPEAKPAVEPAILSAGRADAALVVPVEASEPAPKTVPGTVSIPKKVPGTFSQRRVGPTSLLSGRLW